jgi:hypothetical protein
MKQIMTRWSIAVLAMLLGCFGCAPDKSYGSDYKSLFKEERELALGEHQIGTASQRIERSPGFEDQKMLVWTAVYLDSEGKQRFFEFNNRTSFQRALLEESLSIITDRVATTLEGRISEIIGILGRERFLDNAINESNRQILPHYITYEALPLYILIQIWPLDFAEAQNIAEELSQISDASFYVMTSDMKGLCIVEGVIKDKLYTEIEIRNFPNLP